MYVKSTQAKSKSNSYGKKGGSSKQYKKTGSKSNNKSKSSGCVYKKKRRKQGLLKKINKKIKSKLKKIILRKWNTFKKINFRYDSANSKVFSNTCNWMTLSVVVLCALFVYIEDSLFYTFPLITVIYIFIKKAKGNRYKDYSDKDLMLYKKIILINLFVVLAILFHYQEDLWFINFFMISIFLVPLVIAKYLKS